MPGKLIIIESGADSSGKATQTELLYQRLAAEGRPVIKVAFPNYQSPASALVKMYLNGDFGKNPGDVDPYISSTFYAVDRYASYKTQWEDFYLRGGIVLSDRYTTSNMVHQGAKLEGEEKDDYLDWLWHLEFFLYRLPVPSGVIFLDMPTAFSNQLLAERRQRAGNKNEDIHEQDKAYLESSYQNALYVMKKYDWHRVDCLRSSTLKSITEIHEEVYQEALAVIG